MVVVYDWQVISIAVFLCILGAILLICLEQEKDRWGQALVIIIILVLLFPCFMSGFVLEQETIYGKVDELWVENGDAYMVVGGLTLRDTGATDIPSNIRVGNVVTITYTYRDSAENKYEIEEIN